MVNNISEYQPRSPDKPTTFDRVKVSKTFDLGITNDGAAIFRNEAYEAKIANV